MIADFPVQALVVAAGMAARLGLPIVVIWLLGRVLRRVANPRTEHGTAQ